MSNSPWSAELTPPLFESYLQLRVLKAACMLLLTSLLSFTTKLPAIINLSKMSEKLCLQWSDFQENIKSAIGNLREDKDLQDVTLVSEDGQQVEAHKVVLASSSPFFQKLKELKILNMRERLLNSMLVQSSKKLLAIEKHPARKS